MKKKDRNKIKGRIEIYSRVSETKESTKRGKNKIIQRG